MALMGRIQLLCRAGKETIIQSQGSQERALLIGEEIRSASALDGSGAG